MKPGGTWDRAKRHTIKSISTRRHHPGEHAVELLVNGASLGTRPFTLVMP